MKVIQIYGTSYSGSTMLDLMLGNGDNCLSCGEIYALFKPFNDNHRKPQEGIWEKVRRNGSSDLYLKLGRYGYDYIVDSSKKVDWYEERFTESKNSNIPVHKVCIFKSPEEWAWSVLKRRLPISMDTWVKRYLLIATKVKPDVYIEYKTLAANPGDVLKQLCNHVNIPYFDGKERYWESPNTQLFGNNRARGGTEVIYHGTEKYVHFNTKVSTMLYEYMQEKALKSKPVI